MNDAESAEQFKRESDSSSVDDLLRMTIRLFRIGTESPPRFSPGPAAGVALLARAGPGRKVCNLGIGSSAPEK